MRTHNPARQDAWRGVAVDSPQLCIPTQQPHRYFGGYTVDYTLPPTSCGWVRSQEEMAELLPPGYPYETEWTARPGPVPPDWRKLPPESEDSCSGDGLLRSPLAP